MSVASQGTVSVNSDLLIRHPGKRLSFLNVYFCAIILLVLVLIMELRIMSTVFTR